MSTFSPSFDPSHPVAGIAAELTEVFAAAGYTADGLAGHLGPEYADALWRGEPAAVALGAAGESQLDKIIRLFVLHEPAAATVLADAVGASLATQLFDAAVVTVDGHGTVQVCFDIRPHVIHGRNFWVFSDVDASLVEHVPGPDHVVGVGAASLSLLQSTPTSPVGDVLDLGTGSGVQALGQLECAESITMTDVHPRALELARATMTSASQTLGHSARVEILNGRWFEPVAGRRFDRVVANPPFVVGLPEVGHIYRDSGLNLDGASELVVSQTPEHLNPGGTAHLLAAWAHTGEQTWQQRVASWLPDTGVAAWIVQRDVADPALYVGTWLRDESVDPRSAEGRERTRLWLEHFARHSVTGIGFGFVAIKRIEDDLPSDILAESLTQPFADPLGPEVEEYFQRVEWLRDLLPGEIAEKRFAVRPGLAREDIHVAGDSGFAPAALRLTRTDGPRWSHEIDVHLGAIVAGLNPHGLALEDIVSLYALAEGIDENSLLPEASAAIIDLVRHGLVIPAELLKVEE